MTETKKKQFTELKEMHPDTLLLFRCGDFYESYQEDAESASRILGITLTRDKEGDRQTMFPHYALDTYLPKLIREGHRIAICDVLQEERRLKR
jgi:DNA mismatch repair protein MutS